MTSMNRLAGVKQGTLVVVVCVLIGSWCTRRPRAACRERSWPGTRSPVVAAKVKARHTATDTTFTVTTNDRGAYKLDLLPPGTYQVTAEAPNFGPALVTVNVTLGATATANFDPSTPRSIETARRNRSQGHSFRRQRPRGLDVRGRR